MQVRIPLTTNYTRCIVFGVFQDRPVCSPQAVRLCAADCCVRSRFFFGLAQALLKPVLHTARNQLLPKKGFFFKKGLFLGGKIVPAGAMHQLPDRVPQPTLKPDTKEDFSNALQKDNS